MAAERADAILGGFVLAAAVGFLIYAGHATGFAVQRGGYDISASFRSAEGISVGTDVRLAGVKIGSVTGMTLNPQTFRADLQLNLRDQALMIPEDSAAVVASEGLLGGTYLEIIPGGSPFDLEPGGVIVETQSAVSLVTLLLRFVTGSEEGAQQ
jgi:phospholipid/cholesterol/gamma-HCH transport system substrate-binding protein